MLKIMLNIPYFFEKAFLQLGSCIHPSVHHFSYDNIKKKTKQIQLALYIIGCHRHIQAASSVCSELHTVCALDIVWTVCGL